ncbi:ADP-ribosyl cyclase/cyclic ADP-ribose hydrolase 2 isoform X2 [Caretta caretta]|uniref:ADP-ribosyl cyclase/cyclic ADP-ribose hydrolase 2 isoform X2 n=1 Tax=Caretta caretta TaxID=8467 RepID=UPI0020960E57|nr:ADP-ribosyl cyclase/cyclic ADP-ribose hydrolase 2 isoform X2 [Caretta caretta]
MMNSFFLSLLVGLLFSKDYVKPTEIDGKKKWKGEGTTPNLESIVIGRCYEYIRIVNPSVGEKNCTKIWEAFKKAFMNKDPCNILPSDYELFINLSLHTIPPNKSLFWENNHLLVTSYSDRTRRYMPLCDTLIGSFGDFLNWCGQANDTGFNYDSCPTTEECENNAVETFWKIASITYAKQSSGAIYVMLNGSAIGGAYPVKGDSCGRGSVQILEERLKTMGYDITCVDNYKSVLLLKCLDYLNHPDCSIVSSAPSTQKGLVSPDRDGSWSRLIYTIFLVFVFEICFNLQN